jgi:3-methylfumaryl-CoA hydratase
MSLMGEVREVTELITPGPAEALAGPAEYSYRLVSPLYQDQGLVVSASSDGDTVRVSCRDAADRVTATGQIS